MVNYGIQKSNLKKRSILIKKIPLGICKLFIQLKKKSDTWGFLKSTLAKQSMF